jgi:hypothetical protein
MHRGVGERTPDEPAPKVDARCQLGMQLLELAARLVLSLFITAGFAAALNLYADLSLSSPNVIRACEGIFLWSLALISCVTSRYQTSSPANPPEVSSIIARRSATWAP